MVIRKLSVGADYKTAMHYIVGQRVIGNTHLIHAILLAENSYIVWIENDKKELLMWKSYNTSMPISVEYNIDF